MANKGYVKIYRQIQDCELWIADEPFDLRSAWIDLLLSANHKDKTTLFNYSTITIKRGQLLTSVRKLSARWHWGVKKTYKFLTLLEELEMIHRESDTKKTLVTIVNYGIYQDIGNTDGYTEETERKHRGNTEETQGELNNNVKNDKECKEDILYVPTKSKTKTSKFVVPTIEEIRAYIQEKGYNVDAERFFYHYESNGWMIGKNKMKNWKMAVGTWSKNNFDKGVNNGTRRTNTDSKSDEERDRELEEYINSDRFVDERPFT